MAVTFVGNRGDAGNLLMETLKETIAADGPFFLAIGGLVIGFVFGFVVQRTNFCTMGSISDILSFGDYRRFRAWLLAAAVAIIGAQALQYFGVVDLGQSQYVASSLLWLGNLVGGLVFGFGMVLAGGCTSRNLVRVGGGDLRSLLVLMILGLFAYMTIGGLFAPVRAEIHQFMTVDFDEAGFGTHDFGNVVAGVSGLGNEMGHIIATAVIAGFILIYCLASGAFLKSPAHLIAGFGIGLCVVAGWALTGLAYDEFADTPQMVTSLSYVRPTGDMFEYLRRFTADMTPSFGVTGVFGAISGAFISAVLSGRFKITGFSDTGDLMRNMFGGAAMGVGGVLGFGCTIGQAITGVSTLALGSMLTFVAIVVGGVMGIKYLEYRLLRDA